MVPCETCRRRRAQHVPYVVGLQAERAMAAPTTGNVSSLKRVGRFLIARPRLVQRLDYQGEFVEPLRLHIVARLIPIQGKTGDPRRRR